MNAKIEEAYLAIRPHGLVDRQLQVGPGTILDLDDEDRVVGIKTIGDVPLSMVLAQVLDRARFPRSA